MSTNNVIYSINRESCNQEQKLQQTSKSGSLAARAVTWFKGENDREIVRQWKKVAAVVLAILLAVTVVGILYLIEGIYLWQKKNISKIVLNEDGAETSSITEKASESLSFYNAQLEPHDVNEGPENDEDLYKEATSSQMASGLKEEKNPLSDDDLYGPTNYDAEILYEVEVLKDPIFGSKNLELKKTAESVGKIFTHALTPIPQFLSSGWEGHSLGVPFQYQAFAKTNTFLPVFSVDKAKSESHKGMKEDPENNEDLYEETMSDDDPYDLYSSADNDVKISENFTSLSELDCSSCENLTALPDLSSVQALDSSLVYTSNVFSNLQEPHSCSYDNTTVLSGYSSLQTKILNQKLVIGTKEGQEILEPTASELFSMLEEDHIAKSSGYSVASAKPSKTQHKVSALKNKLLPSFFP